MKKIYKLLILLIRHKPIFSLRGLRDFRAYLYKKYYDAPEIFVAENVIIEHAHANTGSYFCCLGKVNIAKNCYIDYSGGVKIYDRVTLSESVFIYTHEHNIHGLKKDWHQNGVSFSPLEIEKYAWLGAQAIILPSVTNIAEGSIVAAGSVLTKNTESYAIYAGNPAKKIGYRRNDKE